MIQPSEAPQWAKHFPFVDLHLDHYEAFIYLWQYRHLGGFYQSLAEAIARADTGNLERLAKGYPIEVEGYRRFANEPGWWSNVQRKILTAENEHRKGVETV